MNIRTLIVFLWVASALSGVMAGDEPVRLELDASQAGSVISPLLFGHNAEVTRRGVWRGLSAEMIANRKFAAQQDASPTRWTALNSDSRVTVDSEVTFVGPHSVCIEPISGHGGMCGIAQSHEAIALRQGAEYALRIWLRNEAERTVTATIRETIGSEVLFRREWPSGTGDWQLLDATFVAPVTARQLQLEIASSAQGKFWIGAVSLQPTETCRGIRRDVIELLKQLKPGSLRWPGGCYAEFYRWREGLLPVDQRPPIGPTSLSFLLPENDDYDPHEIGIDEFIALCRAVGSEPAITVRLSENSPDDAAALVEYCNGGADTPWGKTRAERGQATPYRVKYWFLGNELFWFGRGGLNDAQTCARQTRLFAQAMKQVDPTIKLVACTFFGKDSEPWNAALLSESGGLIDFCSMHDYLFDRFQGDLASIAKAPTQSLLPLFEHAENKLRSLAQPERIPAVTFDEWNTRWGLSSSVGMGVYVAGVLNLLCREAEPLNIGLAYYFMPINEGAICVTPDSAQLAAAGKVFKLFSTHQNQRRMTTSPLAPDADLDICASLSTDGKSIFLTAVNRNVEHQRTLELIWPDLPGVLDCQIRLLRPYTLQANESEFHELECSPEVAEGHRVLIALPPCAIAGVRLLQKDDTASN